jgi:serine/threonine-protein kinase/endoribonuclease IRE1
MLHPDPTYRLSMEEISIHPFLWDVSKRLQFLVDVSDKLEKEEPTSPLCQLFDNNVIIYSHSINVENSKPSFDVSKNISSSSSFPSFDSSSSVHNIQFSAFDVIGGNWERRVSPLLIENLRIYRKYKPDSIRDLLRVIRNKKNHHEDFTDELKEMVFLLNNHFIFFFHFRLVYFQKVS